MTQSFLHRFKFCTKLLFELNNAARDVHVFPDDTFIVSYPKSGNTWLRFLVANLIHFNKRVTFANIEYFIPDIYKNTQKDLRRIQRPRLLKSHEYYDPRYKRLIYLVRDPRDIVMSYYHYHVKVNYIEEEFPLDKYVSHFIEGRLDRFGSWAEHVGSWRGAKHRDSCFLLVRYEDIHSDAPSELTRIASFLGFDAALAEIDKAILLSNANHMRQLEKREHHLWKSTKNTRQDKPFVRSAQVGTWRNELPFTAAKAIEEQWATQMRSLRYV